MGSKCLLVEGDNEKVENTEPKVDNLASNLNENCLSDTTNDDCSEQMIKSPPFDTEQSLCNIKEPASIETDLVEEPENIGNVVEDRENMTKDSQGNMEIDVKRAYVDDKGVVHIGPTFTGSISIPSHQEIPELIEEFNKGVTISEPDKEPCNAGKINIIPQYQAPITFADCATATRNLSQDNNIQCEDKQTRPLTSPSLDHLVKINQPVDTNDGKQQSLSDQDEFMFPQDNFDVSGGVKKQVCTTTARLLTSLEDKPLTEKRKLEMSRSFDSQQKMLEKGCQLLQTRPRRSSMRLTGQDSSPGTKKYVHFPDDIRNIRKVHKYDSFDESILLRSDNDKDDKFAEEE